MKPFRYFPTQKNFNLFNGRHRIFNVLNNDYTNKQKYIYMRRKYRFFNAVDMRAGVCGANASVEAMALTVCAYVYTWWTVLKIERSGGREMMWK